MADMADDDNQFEEKKSKSSIIAATFTILIGAVVGYFSVDLGFIGAPKTADVQQDFPNRTAPTSEIADLAFVPLDPIIISFSRGNQRQLLRFVGNLEVDPAAISEVEILKPRIIDILNGYLRALQLEDLEEPAALLKIRSQLLHRVKIVAGEERINDLLIVEFVLN